jgi:hypothetical protein
VPVAVNDRVRIKVCDTGREGHPDHIGTIVLVEETDGTIYHVDCGSFICSAREVELVGEQK